MHACMWAYVVIRAGYKSEHCADLLFSDQAIEAVGAGAAGSWSINNLGPRIVKNNFDPGFFGEAPYYELCRRVNDIDS